MDQNLGIHILLVGDTARWREQAKSVLPEEYTLHVRTDFVGAIEFLADNTTRINLCILANNLCEKDAGLRIVEELQEADDPRVILYTREISDASRFHAKELGAVVIDMGDTQGLSAAVKTLIEI